MLRRLGQMFSDRFVRTDGLLATSTPRARPIPKRWSTVEGPFQVILELPPDSIGETARTAAMRTIHRWRSGAQTEPSGDLHPALYLGEGLVMAGLSTGEDQLLLDAAELCRRVFLLQRKDGSLPPRACRPTAPGRADVAAQALRLASTCVQLGVTDSDRWKEPMDRLRTSLLDHVTPEGRSAVLACGERLRPAQHLVRDLRSSGPAVPHADPRSARAGSDRLRMTPGDTRGREVLVILHEPTFGGATQTVLKLVPYLEARGWRFAFWGPCPSPVSERLAKQGHPVFGQARPFAYSGRALREPPGLTVRVRNTPGYTRALSRLIRVRRPAVVHVNSVVAIPEAGIARFAGAPVVFHLHEVLRGLRGGAARRLLPVVADEVVAVSGVVADSLPPSKVRARTIYNGVELQEAQPIRRDGPLVVGTLGTICARKGSDVFVEAARLLGGSSHRFRFRMAGPQALGVEAAWAREVTQRAADVGVEVLGPVDGLSELRQWDLVVVPSRDEGFSLAAAEGMAAGVPVIATLVGAIPEVVADAGKLIPPTDPIALAESIAGLARDSAARERLAAAGRARVAQLFTLEHQADGFDSAYTETTSRCKGGGGGIRTLERPIGR